MANIFKQNLDITEHPNRNNHDLSHKVHGTYKMGYIYPFLCKPVVPNDSFRIDTACGFQLMPMPFPTQSNIRCIFHYFYVRNKNLWENWENWHEGLEEHTPPYINQGSDFYKTGSLADYLDIPTTIVRNESITYSTQNQSFTDGVSNIGYHGQYMIGPSLYVGELNYDFQILTDEETSTDGQFLLTNSFPFFDVRSSFNSRPSFSCKFPGGIFGFGTSHTAEQVTNYCKSRIYLAVYASKYPLSRNYNNIRLIDTYQFSNIDSSLYTFAVDTVTISEESFLRVEMAFTTRGTAVTEFWNQVFENARQLINDDEFVSFGLIFHPQSNSQLTPVNPLDLPSMGGLHVIISLDSPTGIYELSSTASCPFYSSSNDGADTEKISALPFRAYESIYYAYYANSVLQPLKINGETKYNRYNTTLEDGADATPYHLFQRNWELDAYTSCLPSPQQGNMPLVGITDAGDLRISDPNTGEQSRFHLIQDGDRQTIQVDNVSNPEHSRLALDLVTSGITIPDFREVNAYQRLKEQALRSGYKYKDFVKGNFGISPKQNELDMPEFIGGFSQRVDVNMISNTNGITPADSSNVLGSFAGQGRAFGGSKHGISHYFDDYGWIIGVMMIVPDCAYSQLLPKHFIYNERLDYYFPQFAQLGFQPITYGEVAPIQSHLQYTGGQTSKLLTDVFGYQRPNHEYVWYPDSIHGQIRKSLNNIVINRVFDSRPELSDEFLKIDPKDTDKIFAVTEDDNDVVVGQIAMKITAKRPIPRIVIPTLGR